MRTLYELLGVSTEASPNEITQAFTTQAEKLRAVDPSHSQFADAEIRLKALREAYDILSDPSRRASYDARLAAKLNPSVTTEQSTGFAWTPVKILAVVAVGVVVLTGAAQVFVQWQAVSASRAAMERSQADMRERMEMEQQMNSAVSEAAQARREEYEQRREAERAEREARLAEQRHQQQLEQDRRYAEQVSRDLQRGEKDAARAEARRLAEIERQHENAERKRMEEDRAALRRLEEEKRKAAQREYEILNRR